MKTDGWAAMQDDKILVATVSATRTGAMVNWLATESALLVWDRLSDAEIELIWQVQGERHGARIIEVTICERPA
jgi:hypothetical protein